MHLRVGGNDVAQQGFGALDVDGEIVVDEKTAIWPPSLLARAFNCSNSLTTLSLLRKRIESPKKPVTVQNSHP
ncbi:MAG: hypothetical protein IPL01_11340 [Acidobacteria bacterium]|nr:hypothetical protein [Acidobacteriota bacterium]